MELLPSLNVPRINHGCTVLSGLHGETAIVAGGWLGGYIPYVEILRKGEERWALAQSLPEMRWVEYIYVLLVNVVNIVGECCKYGRDRGSLALLMLC